MLTEIQLAFAVLALYFRTEQTRGSSGSAAVISTFLMLPVSVLIPWMFAVRCLVRVFAGDRTGDCRLNLVIPNVYRQGKAFSAELFTK